MNSEMRSLEIPDVQSPRQWLQLGVLVLDGSGSMNEKTDGNIAKAEATALATRELFERFKKRSACPQNFMFAVITYDDHPTPVIDPPISATQVDETGDYNPLNGHGDGTCIYSALESAERVVEEFLARAPQGGVPHSAVILLMSDGLCSDPDRTREVARRIRQRFGNQVKIAAAFFATAGKPDPRGEQLLRDIVDDSETFFCSVTSGEKLRDFFKRSLSEAAGGAVVI
jgi:Mg-chelatase subunit ChlD